MTNRLAPERLYRNLPAVLRIRDDAEGYPLRALLQVVETELRRVEDDIAGLYDNWFIETCAEWVVPYIGDLLGVRPIQSIESAGVSLRAYVANTLRYRRRKGTAAVLEQLARDVTGWPSHAVEFFSSLATAQHVNHIRLSAPATAPIRDAEEAELAGTAFDRFSHTLDVRRIARGRGRYNIPNVGIFLWRLQSYPIGRLDLDGKPTDYGTAARRTDLSGRTYFTFNPVGRDAPLFNSPRREETITQLSREENVPGRLRRLALNEDLDEIRKAAGTSSPPKNVRFLVPARPTIRVFIEPSGGGEPVEVRREDIYTCDIPDEVELVSPVPIAVAIDPERGRLVFPEALDPSRVFVTFSYGFSGDLGGGPYDRTQSIESADEIVEDQSDSGATEERRSFLSDEVWQVGVSHRSVGGPGQLFATLREAVDAWNTEPEGRIGVIAVMDSVTDDAAAPAIEIDIKKGSRLLIVAADWPVEDDPKNPGVMRRRPGRLRGFGLRPHFVGDVIVRGSAPPGSPDPGALIVNGLLVEGRVLVSEGHLGVLGIDHCTLVPDFGGLAVLGGNPRLRIVMRRSISGPISIPIRGPRIRIEDSIVDGVSGSPDFAVAAEETEAQMRSSTFIGSVDVQSISASDCIFNGLVRARRRQVGCVRFSYVPAGSNAPRRYRCQPDSAIAERTAAARDAAVALGKELIAAEERAIRNEVRGWLAPLFRSATYGEPDFAQLSLRCPIEIRTGAESGSEMGAFSFLEQPQREANLRRAADEYLRLGLELGVFLVT